MNRFEPVNPETAPDDGFDLVIDLDPVSSSRENLETVISRLYTEYPKLFGGTDMPTADDMDAAIEAAMNDYQVDIKHEIKGRDDRNRTNHSNGVQPQPNGQSKSKQRSIEYFAVKVSPPRVTSILDTMLRDAPADVAKMYNALKGQRRVQAEFHVTLIHRAMAGQNQEEWHKLSELYNNASPDPKIGSCRVRLERLVWDDRIMAFVVRLSPADGSNELFTSVNKIPHITVGTASPDVKPKESNDLLVRWLQEGSGQNGIQELAVKGNVELEGTVACVLSR